MTADTSATSSRRGRGGIRIALAVTAATLAVVNRVAARRADPPPPPADRFVCVDGVRLHYLEQGRGSSVVLLHGNGAMAEDFRIAGILERLAVRHRVIAFDRPGFGYSERPHDRVWSFDAQAGLLRRALRRIGVDRAVLVGHSSGTQVALAMALRDPDGTAALALLSGFYFPRFRTDILLSALLALPGLRQAAAFGTAHLFG